MTLQGLVRRGLRLTERQTHDFKIILARRALHGLATGLTTQYNSLYATLLGANPVQLGSLQSVGNAVGALATLPAGWFIDYYGRKGVFLVGTAMLAASGVLYFVAPDWIWLYGAVMIYYLGAHITCTTCTVACAAELPNKGRATGRGLCRTLSSPVAVVSPLLAAWIISRFGGISVAGLRPLYAVQACVFVAILVLLLTRLSNRQAQNRRHDGDQILPGFAEVFKQGPDVVRLLGVMGLMMLPWNVTQPFVSVYAHEFKGANEFALGGIAITSVLVPMLLSIPFGRAADRYGRKKLLFLVAPLAYVANLVLILAPPSGPGASLCLLLYGLLFGFNSIGMVLAASMAAEVMPQEQMGRWIGVVGLCRGLLSIPAPTLGGLIWTKIGPEYVFLVAIGIDVCLRLPLLALTRETLHLRQDDSQDEV